MKKEKRILSLIVSIAMLVGIICPTSVFAAPEATATVAFYVAPQDAENVNIEVTKVEVSVEPTEEPNEASTEEPSADATELPEEETASLAAEEDDPDSTEAPTAEPTEEPTAEPTEEPTPEPTETPAPPADVQYFVYNYEEGTYTFTVTADNYNSYTDAFTITSENIGSMLMINVNLVPNKADYSKLEAAVAAAKTYNQADYTEKSMEALTNAINAAEGLDTELTFKDQSIIDSAVADIETAINGLIKMVTVSARAVAVSTDVSKNNGASDTVHIIFGSPTNGADIISYMSLDGENSLGSSTGIWNSTNTVYTIALADDAQIKNGAKLTYNTSDSFTDYNGAVIRTIPDVIVEGNLEGAGDLIAPTEMAAVIVKSSARPTASKGDSIVVVFNAPVADTLSPGDLGITAADVTGAFDATSTIYTITIDSNETGLVVPMTLAYGAITADVAGSFGESIVVKALTAFAIDNDGTPLTKNDTIKVIFNAPTNACAISLAETFGTGATAVWENENTVLAITVGENAEIANGGTISLAGLGIKDEYDITDAVDVDAIAIKGSFGEVIVPQLKRAIAVDCDNTALVAGDKILFVFDAPTNGAAVDLSLVGINTPDVSLGNSTAQWTTNNTILVVELGSSAKMVNNASFDLSKLGIKDQYSVADANVTDSITVEGSFGISLRPRITKAVAYTQGETDVIRTYFNVPIMGTNGNELDYSISAANGHELDYGDGVRAELSTTGTYFTVVLGKNHGPFASGEYSIVFNNSTVDIIDRETGRLTLENYSSVITGSFAEAITPEVLSVTAISNDGSGIAKAGDAIYVVFNTTIIAESGSISAGNGSLGSNYNISYGESENILKITLGNNCDITPGVTTLEIKDYIESATGSKDMEKPVVLEVGGTFGHEIAPKLLSVTAVSNDGSGVAKAGDKIYVVYSAAVDVSGATAKIAGKNLGVLSNTEDAAVVVIEIAEDGIVKVGDTITINGLTSAATGKAINDEAVLGGTFGHSVTPEVLSVTAVSNDGSGVAKKGDRIYIVFNTPVVADNASIVMTASAGVNYEIKDEQISGENTSIIVVTLGENPSIDMNTKVTISGYKALGSGIAMAATEKKLEGSFGQLIESHLVKAVAVSNDGSGISKKGDIIYAIFDAEVRTSADTMAKVGEKSIGTVSEGIASVVKITLGDADVNIGDTLVLTNVISVSTDQKIENATAVISGSFGQLVEPKLISLTAVSNDGSGVAKQGDKIYAVYSADVSISEAAAAKTASGATVGKVSAGDNASVVVIEIGADYAVEIGETITITGLTSVSTGKAVESASMALAGSFGQLVEPKLIKVIAVSNDGSGVSKKGDKIYAIFNTAVTTTASTAAKIGETSIGTVEVGNSPVVIITLGDSKVTIGDTLVLTNVTSTATGKPIEGIAKEIEGSFGAPVAAKMNSAVIYNDENGTYIEIVFSKAIDTDSSANKITEILANGDKNEISLNKVELSDEKTTLKLTLPNSKQIKNDSTFDLSALNIVDSAMGVAVTNINNVKVSGTVIPYVKSVTATMENPNGNATEGKSYIVVEFSARTNGATDLSKLTALLGTGAKAEWINDNMTLIITLGEDYTVTNNGYIVLNDIGIKDGYSNSIPVTGQYKVTGSLDSDTLVLTKIMASSENTATDLSGKGDTITLFFNTYSDINGASLGQVLSDEQVRAIISSVIEVPEATAEPATTAEPEATAAPEEDAELAETKTLEAAFGAGYTAIWNAYDQLVITLGEDPTVKIGDKLVVGGIGFANGDGVMADTEMEISGSFDGRDLLLKNYDITRTNGTAGDYRVRVEIERVKDKDITPTLVCVALNESGKTVTLVRTTFDIKYTDEASAIFELPKSYNLAKVRVFAFNGELSDLNNVQPIDVLAVPVEVMATKVK